MYSRNLTTYDYILSLLLFFSNAFRGMSFNGAVEGQNWLEDWFALNTAVLLGKEIEQCYERLEETINNCGE